MRLVLHRLLKLDDRTLGRLFVFSDLDLVGSFATLELPFKNNERQKSSIPSAFYRVEPRTSEKYGNHLHVLDVPGRDYILFHQGNYPKDTTGCVIVGSDFKDIDNDARPEVINSKAAMRQLTTLVTGSAELIII